MGRKEIIYLTPRTIKEHASAIQELADKRVEIVDFIIKADKWTPKTLYLEYKDKKLKLEQAIIKHALKIKEIADGYK